MVCIFVTRSFVAGWFCIVRGLHRDSKRLHFLKKLYQTVLTTYRIAEMKSYSWCCQIEVHYSNLHTGTSGVQLIKAQQQNRAYFFLVRRWYCLLKNIKSIRELVVFKITNVKVGHLCNFSDFTWRKSEPSCDGNV
jgi:hypothetical protein